MENIMKMVFIYFYGRLTLTQNALQSNINGWKFAILVAGWLFTEYYHHFDLNIHFYQI